MANILINATNIKIGGGIQVANSICSSLGRFENHNIIVVLSSMLETTYQQINNRWSNVIVYQHDIKNSVQTLLFGRDKFLDDLVEDHHIQCVLTIFGPSRWVPKCKHLCGFASAQLVLKDSPYYTQRLPLKVFIKEKVRNAILKHFYIKSGPNYYTENPFISVLVGKLFPFGKVYTVTNYYNQVFDEPSSWMPCQLPIFDGVTFLTVSSPYTHKNLGIAVKIAELLEKRSVAFNYRFVFTVDKKDFPEVPLHLLSHFLFIGKVDIRQCPSLYQQADFMFQPSLLECFTATYVEAMKMEVPIITTDLDFAHGLCGDAALFYEPLSAEDATDKIIRLVEDISLRNRLKSNGLEQLKHFDNYNQRVDKLIKIVENLIS